MSDAEEALAFQVRALGLPEPEREHRFRGLSGKRRWRFDLAWPEHMVACEVEGGTWVRGRHNRPEGYQRDCEKYSEAALCGWQVIRVTTAMVYDGTAIGYVEKALGGDA